MANGPSFEKNVAPSPGAKEAHEAPMTPSGPATDPMPIPPLVGESTAPAGQGLAAPLPPARVGETTAPAGQGLAAPLPSPSPPRSPLPAAGTPAAGTAFATDPRVTEASPSPPGKAPAFWARRKKRGNEICQILIRAGDVQPEHVRRALRIQEERGGQIGRILVKMGACSERAIARALTKQVQLAHAAGKRKNLSLLARKNPALAGLEVKCKPKLTTAVLLFADVLVLGAIGGLASACDYAIAHHLSQSLTHYGFAALVLCALVLGAVGTYAPTAPSPPDEIRRTTLAVTLIFLCDALVAMFGMEWIPWHVHAILFFEWVLCVVTLPIFRAVIRTRLSRTAWWGVPIVVLGAGRTGRTLVRALQTRPHVGLRPVLILDDDTKKHGTLRASIASGNRIQVQSIRDAPVHSIAHIDATSSLDGPASIAFRGDSAQQLSRDGARGSAKEVAPHTIRSPSTISSWPPKAKDSSYPPPPDAPERNSMFPAAPPSVPPTAPAGALSDSSPPQSSSEPPLRRSDPPPGLGSNPPKGRSSYPPARGSYPPPTPRPHVPSSRLAPSSKHEPSWARVIPESLRGFVRGQFAEVEGVPVIGGLDLAPLLAKRLAVSYAILAMPGQSSRRLLQVTERIGGAFSHLLVIPDLIGFASIGVPAREVGGVVGIEVRQQLLLRGPRVAKRLMDLAFTLVGCLFIAPIILLLALLIRLDSKGPAFYSQKRMGRDGRQFVAYKFRSMHGDGEARLKAVLEADPKLRAEYDEFHKLANDPRVTRIGRIIRKYSLDELPQLLNVLRGEMSLVGPRPYLEREVPEMGRQEGIILRAMPGLTGLWQVSDRNATGFAERLKMDVHYVRNWSPWLDIYVLARTVGVVIAGTGS